MTNPEIEEGPELPPLDQSNGEQQEPESDLNLRTFALNVAAGLAINSKTGWVPETVIRAREFYLFLSGKDPVVDHIGPLPDNVVSLDERRAAIKGR